MKLLTKIQRLPEEKKKKILWSVMVVVAIILLIFYLNRAHNTIQNLGKSNPAQELQTNTLKEKIINIFENK